MSGGTKGHTNLFKFTLSLLKFKFTYLTCLSVHDLLLAPRMKVLKSYQKHSTISTLNIYL